MPNQITINCPHCDVKLLLKDSKLIGRKARCRGCGEVFVIAADDEPEDGWFGVQEEGEGTAGEEDFFPPASELPTDEFIFDESEADEFAYDETHRETTYRLSDEHPVVPSTEESKQDNRKNDNADPDSTYRLSDEHPSLQNSSPGRRKTKKLRRNPRS